MAVDDRAIVVIVGVVLRVEPDGRRVRRARSREQDRAGREAARQVRQRVDVGIVANVVLRIRPFGGKIERVERGFAAEEMLVRVVVHVPGQGVIRLELDAVREPVSERDGEAIVPRARGRLVDRENADRRVGPDGCKDWHARRVHGRREDISIEPALEVAGGAEYITD